MTQIEGGSRRTSSPTGPRRRSTSATRPDRTRRRARSASAQLVPAGRVESLGDSPPARVARLATRAAAARRGRLRARAEAGLDARGRVHRAGDRRGQPRARRDAVRAPARRAGRDRRARADVRGAAALLRVASAVPVSPVLERQTTYPFVRLNEARRRVEARGIEVIDFGMGDPQRADRPADPRGARRRGLRERIGLPARRRAARAARGDRRLGRSAASASSSTRTRR